MVVGSLHLGRPGTAKCDEVSIVHTIAEVDWEMKAASILLVVLVTAVAAMAVAAAHPVNPVGALPAPEFGMEPVWMVLSGAALLMLASAVRKYIP